MIRGFNTTGRSRSFKPKDVKMQNLQRNGFDRYTSDTVGDSLRTKGREWLRAGMPADTGINYVALMRTMKMGGSTWVDSKLKELSRTW